VKDILKADIDFRFCSGFELDVAFSADAGQITTLEGPSGSGKSTLLSLIAGTLSPMSGKIELGPRVLFSSEPAIDVAPWRRRVGLLFQSDTLFPHLTVRKNLNFGARNKSDSPWQFAEITELFQIAELLDRKPSQLSGGQRDRVALGRTLLSQPEILLLDEPLNSVEDSLREQIFDFVCEGVDQLGIPGLLVSHDTNLRARTTGSGFKIENGVLSHG